MTHLTSENQDKIRSNQANFERFAEGESARIEHLIRQAKVELKAYQVISNLYACIGQGTMVEIPDSSYGSEKNHDSSAVVRHFRLPDGAVVSASKNAERAHASVEVGHHVSEDGDNSGTLSRYHADFRVYVWPDAAYETVRAVEFGEQDSQVVAADTNLPRRALDDLVDNVLSLTQSAE